MAEKIHPVSFRCPTIEDAAEVFQLILECDRHSLGEEDSSMEDLLYGWEQAELEKDAWLALTPGGVLVGYVGLIPSGENRHLEIYVTPSWENSQLYTMLVSRAEGRARELSVASPNRSLTLTVYEPYANQAQIQALTAASFQQVCSHYQMQIKLDEPMQIPHLPAGIHTRTTDPGTDLPEIHALIQAAFGKPGQPPQPYAEWIAMMARDDIFDPSLWWMAFASDRLVGVCLAFAYPSMGWIRQLGVAADFRRRGLGGALLRQAFLEFQTRGFKRAGLGVRAVNPAAISLYQGVGMHIARLFEEYAREFSADT